MEPGPLEVVDLSTLDLSVQLPPWPSDAWDGIYDLDVLLAEVDADLAGMTAELEQDWRGELEALTAAASEGIWHDPLPADMEELEGAAEAAAEADAQVIDAYAEVPPETWQPVPAPYTPPVDAGEFLPTPPAPGAPWDVQPTAPLPGGAARVPARVQLTNLTEGGSLRYSVGAEWLLELTGMPLSPVYCSGYHDQVVFGPAGFGVTDELGRFALRGRMTEAELGSWAQSWYVAGELCEPVLRFEVV